MRGRIFFFIIYRKLRRAKGVSPCKVAVVSPCWFKLVYDYVNVIALHPLSDTIRIIGTHNHARKLKQKKYVFSRIKLESTITFVTEIFWELLFANGIELTNGGKKELFEFAKVTLNSLLSCWFTLRLTTFLTNLVINSSAAG